MLKRILNQPERITYQRLNELCDRRSAQIYTKVRIADVLPIEGSGLSNELFDFALTSHFDFVVTDLGQSPLFAVEFDGPGHDRIVQGMRDSKKGELSRIFKLPLLRIRSDDLHRTESQLDRLSEQADRWFDELSDRSLDRQAAALRRRIVPRLGSHAMLDKAICPNCGSDMVVKNGKYGPFLSCETFPKCRGSIDLPRPTAPIRNQVDIQQRPSTLSIPSGRLIGTSAFVLFLVISIILMVRSSNRNVAERIEKPFVVSNAVATRADVAKSEAATVRQRSFLDSLISKHGWVNEERDARINRILGYNRSYSALSKKEASELITALDDQRIEKPSVVSDAVATPADVVKSEAATVRQRSFLDSLISKRGWEIEERNAEINRILGYNRSYSELSKKEASRLITALDDRGK